MEDEELAVFNWGLPSLGIDSGCGDPYGKEPTDGSPGVGQALGVRMSDVVHPKRNEDVPN